MRSVKHGCLAVNMTRFAGSYRNFAQDGVAAAGPLCLCCRELAVAGLQLVQHRCLLPFELARHLEGDTCHLQH
jgi:hypothetical protein